MATKVAQQQFQERLLSLLNQLAEAERAKEDARAELVRICGEGWTDVAEALFTEQRFVCDSCKRDWAGSEMINDEVCYPCEAKQRAALARS